MIQLTPSFPLLLIATVFSPAQDSVLLSEEERERARIEALASPSTDTSPAAESLDAELARVVASLASRGDHQSLGGLGPAGLEALVQLVDATPLDALLVRERSMITRRDNNPLLLLAKVSPARAADYLGSLLVRDPKRYELLAPTDNGVATLLREAEEGGEHALYRLLDLTTAATGLRLETRLEIAAKFLSFGFETKSSRSLLFDSMEHWPHIDEAYALGGLLAREAPEKIEALDERLAVHLASRSLPVADALYEHRSVGIRLASVGGLINHLDARAEALGKLANDADQRVAANAWWRLLHHGGDVPPRAMLGVLRGLARHEVLDQSEEFVWQYPMRLMPDGVSDALKLSLEGATQADRDSLVELLRAVYLDDRMKFLHPALLETYSSLGDGPVMHALLRARGAPKEHVEAAFSSLASGTSEQRRAELVLDAVKSASQAVRYEISVREESPFGAVGPDRAVEAVLVHAGSGGFCRNTPLRNDLRALGRANKAELGAALLDPKSDLDATSSAYLSLALLHADELPGDVLEAVQTSLVAAARSSAGRNAIGWVFGYPGEIDWQLRSLHWTQGILSLAEHWPAADSLPIGLDLGSKLHEHPPEVQQRIMALAERLLNEPGHLGKNTFMLNSEALVLLMGARPDLTTPAMMRRFVRGSDWVRETAVTIALELDNQELRNAAVESLLDGLKNPSEARPTYTDQLLRFGDPEIVTAILDLATASGDGPYIEFVDQRLGQLTRLRATKTQWQEGLAGAPTRAGAIVSLLELLGSGEGEVRVEAIRGLATLGAVETVPQLIEVLATGTEAEKAAARESLAHLRRVAAQEVEAR